MTLWNCISCAKTFSRKGDLTRHQLLHTGIKPHVCPTCGKGFAQFSGLKTHLNIHTKAKPYVCGIGTCRKAFGDPSSCSRHRKETHRAEGAYKCPLPDCGTRIKRRAAFATHLRKHGIDPCTVDLSAIASGAITQLDNMQFQSPAVHTRESEGQSSVSAIGPNNQVSGYSLAQRSPEVLFSSQGNDLYSSYSSPGYSIPSLTQYPPNQCASLVGMQPSDVLFADISGKHGYVDNFWSVDFPLVPFPRTSLLSKHIQTKTAHPRAPRHPLRYRVALPWTC
ncbi:hypothetical protein EDC04DRAFT_630350 [Pisolithus marmoratus]|nr:hypothetical protein EDC04DRAFT_630350 [Pisolithus marmoratus]